MSTAGVGDSWGNLPWLSQAFLRWTNVKYALEDHRLVDKEIRLTKMDWTLVRAVRLQFDDRKPTDTKKNVKTLGSKGDGMSLTDSVSVTSVASFLVKVAVEGLTLRPKRSGCGQSTRPRKSWTLLISLYHARRLPDRIRFDCSAYCHLLESVPPQFFRAWTKKRIEDLRIE
jgi:hypothetical protein